MRTIPRWVLAALGLTLLAVAGAAAVTYDRYIRHPWFLAAPARASRARLLASGLELVTPPGAGPFPTVLLIPGCGGVHGDKGPNPIMDEYARSAVAAGWAAAILDSYSPRKWEPAWARRRVCNGLLLQGYRRAADVLAGLDLLQANPRVDHRRLRIASWSHGGWAVGDLVTLPDPGDGSFSAAMADVEAIYFTYPWCKFPSQGGRRDWTWKGGVRFVFVEHDTVQDAEGCRPMVDRARKAGAQVETVMFTGVTHAFDERVQTPDSRFRFDQAAADRAHALFIAWLKTPAPFPSGPRPQPGRQG
jgi:dienelactone hydrolase